MTKKRGKKMKIYVAGPYSAEAKTTMTKNTNKAVGVGIELHKRGHIPYIPHMSHWIDKHPACNLTWKDYMKWHLAFLRHCDGLFFIAESPGANKELKEAKKFGLKIYRSLDEIEPVL